MTGSAGDSIDRAAVRRNSRRLLLVVAGVALLGLSGGVLAVALSGGDDGGTRPRRHSALQIVIPVGVLLLTLALCFLVLRLAMRRASFRAVMQYGWSERRAAHKAVKSGRPLSDREVDVVRASLAYQERAGWSVWLWPAQSVLWVLLSLDHRGLVRWLMLALAVVYAALWPWAAWERRRVLARYRDALPPGDSANSIADGGF